MKEFLKSKKFLIFLGAIILIGGLIFAFTNTRREEQNNESHKKSYVAYIKINPLVKVLFDITSDSDDFDNCENFSSNVTDITLLNDDASVLYKDLEYKDKHLEDVVSSLILVAKENNIATSNINITTNWANEKFLEKLKTSDDVKFNINYQKSINEEEIIKSYEKTYTVTFDSDGAKKVESQIVLENKIVNKPVDPVLDGYIFIEWQLDGKTYDFSSEVKRDITLKAKWQKNNEQTNAKSDTNSTNSNTSSEKVVSQKEKDNATLKSQLQAKGLTWDFNTEEEANNLLDKWSGGYGGEIIKNFYGQSDTAYSVKITLNTAACGGKEILSIDWHNNSPVDFIYYLHSKGYNCAGNQGYYNGKHFIVNEKNEIVYD